MCSKASFLTHIPKSHLDIHIVIPSKFLLSYNLRAELHHHLPLALEHGLTILGELDKKNGENFVGVFTITDSMKFGGIYGLGTTSRFWLQKYAGIS
jgi:hypothetical protein